MIKSVFNYVYDNVVLQGRKTEHSVHPLILSRTSPREMTGENILDSELLPLFEAARWAPSHFNAQPWRFIYAKRGTTHWDKLYNLVNFRNQRWCDKASALVLVIAHKWTDSFVFGLIKPMAIPTASFDTGAACMALALEASGRDLVAHCMVGMDYDKAYEVFGIDRRMDSIECMIAIGKRPALENRAKPRISQRNPIESYVFEGFYNSDNNHNN